MLCPSEIFKKKQTTMLCALLTDQDQECSKREYEVEWKDHTLVTAK